MIYLNLFVMLENCRLRWLIMFLLAVTLQTSIRDWFIGILIQISGAYPEWLNKFTLWSNNIGSSLLAPQTIIIFHIPPGILWWYRCYWIPVRHAIRQRLAITRQHASLDQTMVLVPSTGCSLNHLYTESDALIRKQESLIAIFASKTSNKWLLGKHAPCTT